MAKSLAVGDKAPEFTLLDQDGEKVSLKEFRGQKVLVYFYPKASTPGCTTQACALSESEDELAKANIKVLGISADPVKKLKNFQEKKDLNITLLSNEDRSVIEAYGSWGPKKFMGKEFDGILRQSFLIDPKGKIIHIMNKVETKNHHTQILDLFKRLSK